MIAQFKFSETSPAAAGTVASSSPVQNAASYLPAGVAGPLDDGFSVQFNFFLIGATGGTLDVYVQTSGDNGQTWIDQIHLPQLANGAAAINYTATLSSISQPASAAPVVVGSGLTPALAANVVVQGLGFSRARLVFVAGSGTTAGAAVTVNVTVQRTRE